MIGEIMVLGKKDLGRKKYNLKTKLKLLEEKARFDSLNKNQAFYSKIKE